MIATNSRLFPGLPVVMMLAFMLSACSVKQEPHENAGPEATTPAVVQTEFDMNSWKTTIDNECRSFFDGCNNCFREPGKMAACTRKACAVYQQPRCLDDAAASDSTQATSAKEIDYVCDADKSFSVSYHEYVQADQRQRLKDSEIVFSDHQTHEALRLQREPSASGEQYIDSAGFRFFAKGDEALVMQQDSRLYSNCKIKQ
jgi:membrane-bound inhibitor of C-type lysozyme